jgi:hypothetical protein
MSAVTTGERLAILAGGGPIVLEVATAARRRGRDVRIVALEGIADQDLSAFPHQRVHIGAVAGLLAALKATDARDLVLIGEVRRPSLGMLRPDRGWLTHARELVPLFAGGDDSVLRRIARFFEANGHRIVGIGDVAPELMAGIGLITPGGLDAAARRSAERGLACIATLGRFDIGQGVVVGDGRIVAVEGVEGTDRMLAGLAERGTGSGAILVKGPKPGQHPALDLPTVGPRTVIAAAGAGLAAIALDGVSVVVAQREALLKEAAAAAMAIEGLARPPPLADGSLPRLSIDGSAPSRATGLASLRAALRLGVGGAAEADAMLGARIVVAGRLHRLAGIVVVAHGHPLAVGADEPAASVLDRIGRERQRRGLYRKTGGALVLEHGSRLDAGLVRAAKAAGLAAIGVLTRPGSEPEGAAWCAAAGLALYRIAERAAEDRGP